MSLPGENTKFYETPNHPFQGERIGEERGLMDRYGLKNKEELWRAQSELRSFRREARRLLGDITGDESADGGEFLSRLKRIGVLDDGDELGDVLLLEITDVLERRLQTVAYRKGLANTPQQARQFITHGHVTVDGRRVSIPSYKVEIVEEGSVAFDENSPLADELHPERAEGNE
ncbi:SSU ribosomal protein S4P [Haladaptatus litoreus]|uniref:Small ribosomal subunit protein uS4 n=1 Tax=Haladaptatus litoreus TaxID=553468 RepID=A0A1N6XA00_9EURY|nr:30S ribosomal protein S4 [Haladaptatus litoreus]SIQ99168.1 SSU ribosomal protein S4P [Haladaptatus litoreus]